MKPLTFALPWLLAGAPLVAACGSDPGSLEGGLLAPSGPPAATAKGSGDQQNPGSGQKQPSGPSTNPTTDAGTPTAVDASVDSGVAPPPGITSNKATDYFVQAVFPSIEQTCGVCHNAPGTAGAPGFLSTVAATAYSSIEARGYIAPASMLLKKGSHEGPALTAQQTTDIGQWLSLENEVRGSKTPVDLLSKLGNCLDQTKFQAIALQNLRTIKRNNENANNCTGCNQAPCQTCHQQGEYAMHSNFSNLGQKTWDALVANARSPEGVYLISKYITTNGTNLVPSTALKDKAAVTATGPAYSHPMFQISTTMETAIEAFANDAITKYNAKTCGQ